MISFKFFLLLLIPIAACNKNNNVLQPDSSLSSNTTYFPPNSGTDWETMSISSLGWNENAVAPLLDYLKSTHTKSFMILVNGRIVMENYFNGQTQTGTWRWNSAGKTLVTEAIGIAQQEGLLHINDPVSQYLGEGWSSEPVEKEKLITIRHLLTMTSGLNDEKEVVIKANLTYKADAGKRWSYSNVFQLLMDIIENASGEKFEDYFKANIGDKIGMKGFWKNGIIFRIYHSNARSMARFGLLALNNGKWNGKQIIDEDFFKQAIRTSQNINPSYGYLWWLNGKTSYMVPGSQKHFQGYIIPNAPSGMFAAMGAQDQRIYVIPGKKMVIVRMGEAANPENPTFAVSGFDTALWGKIDTLIN